jgi:Flp pilus assembly protein TadB
MAISRKGGEMGPLSEHERKVLKELEMSLLIESSDPLHQTAQREYQRSRRRVLVGALTFLIGAAVMIIFLTESLIVSLAGLFVMIAGSLFFACNAQLARRASKMTKDPLSGGPSA